MSTNRLRGYKLCFSPEAQSVMALLVAHPNVFADLGGLKPAGRGDLIDHAYGLCEGFTAVGGEPRVVLTVQAHVFRRDKHALVLAQQWVAVRHALTIEFMHLGLVLSLRDSACANEH
jgi:hypothetical protein